MCRLEVLKSLMYCFFGKSARESETRKGKARVVEPEKSVPPEGLSLIPSETDSEERDAHTLIDCVCVCVCRVAAGTGLVDDILDGV